MKPRALNALSTSRRALLDKARGHMLNREQFIINQFRFSRVKDTDASSADKFIQYRSARRVKRLWRGTRLSSSFLRWTQSRRPLAWTPFRTPTRQLMVEIL